MNIFLISFFLFISQITEVHSKMNSVEAYPRAKYDIHIQDYIHANGSEYTLSILPKSNSALGSYSCKLTLMKSLVELNGTEYLSNELAAHWKFCKFCNFVKKWFENSFNLK